MRIAFHKMHGAGNDFVVLDEREQSLALTPASIARLADRRTGIGCDQLVLLQTPVEEPDGGDVRVRFFNPDGSEAGACGNASRCVALLVAGDAFGRTLRLRTNAGLLPARVLEPGLVDVDMGVPGLDWHELPLARAADTLHLPLPGDPAGCSMGNPHATLFDNDGEPSVLGAALEHDGLFPERANIGFARILSPDRMRLRVWERGAGLTLACGSGACAAVVNAARRGLTGRRVAVEMPGGLLEIDWGGDDHVRMTGPAIVSFTGQVELDQYR
jgi:diaminopimelate epimerase